MGLGARALDMATPGTGTAAPSIVSAMALVRRTLWLIWYPAIALLTLNNTLQ